MSGNLDDYLAIVTVAGLATRFGGGARNIKSIPCARLRGLPGPGEGGLLRGVCLVPGGSAPGGVPGPRCLVETPLGRLLLRAVRILLECILVYRGGRWCPCPPPGSATESSTSFGPYSRPFRKELCTQHKP